MSAIVLRNGYYCCWKPRTPSWSRGDALLAAVEPATGLPNGSPIQVNTGSRTLLEERTGLALTTRFSENSQHRVYVFHLAVCAEVQKTPPDAENYLGIPGNPRMAVLLCFMSILKSTLLLARSAGLYLREDN